MNSLVLALLMTVPEGSATLPLDEYARLLSRDRPPTSAPPVAATLERVSLAAQVLDDALELSAEIEAVVLGPGWVALPLFPPGAGLELRSPPRLEGATLVDTEAGLALVTDRPGRHAFSLTLAARAEPSGGRRRVTLAVAPALAAALEVRHDPASFRIFGDLAATGEHLHVRPRRGPSGRSFELAWEPIGARAKAAPVARPPVEPVIARTHASWVLTLEGAEILRVRSDLVLETKVPIELGLPPGYRLERAYVNGRTTGVTPAGDALSLEVAPARPGDSRASVELVLHRDRGPLDLSGRVDLALPSASLTTHELFLDVFVPPAFAFRWQGGSLGEVEATPAVSFAHDVPTPGTRHSFRQELIVRSTPHLSLAYSVELEGQFFR